MVHEDLLVKASDFFKAALTNGFLEAHERVIHLPEEKAEVMETFINWLYKDQHPVSASLESADDDLELYYFADKCQILELKKLVIDRLWGLRPKGRMWNMHRIQRIYENTRPSSGLRKLVVHVWTRFMRFSTDTRKPEFIRCWFESNQDIATDFLIEIFFKARDRRKVVWSGLETGETRAKVTASDFYDA